jgi:probable HAF family extracellular repeat protein
MRRLFAALTVTVLLSVLGGNAWGVVQYTVTDLGTLGGYRSSAQDINDRGQVVGLSYTTSNINNHAFLYSNGTMTDLGVSQGELQSRAYGVNTYGQVVGQVWTSSGASHAFLYSDGTTTDLGTLGGSSSFARDINDSGQVVGYSYTSSGIYHAYS